MAWAQCNCYAWGHHRKWRCGAVVTHDVEPYAVVAGVPARKLRMRFSEEIIQGLETSRWWDWDYETLKARLPEFEDVDAFVAKYGQPLK